MFIIMIISLTLFSFVRRKIFRSKFFLSIAVSSNAFYLASVQIDKMKVAWGVLLFTILSRIKDQAPRLEPTVRDLPFNNLIIYSFIYNPYR